MADSSCFRLHIIQFHNADDDALVRNNEELRSLVEDYLSLFYELEDRKRREQIFAQNRTVLLKFYENVSDFYRDEALVLVDMDKQRAMNAGSLSVIAMLEKAGQVLGHKLPEGTWFRVPTKFGEYGVRRDKRDEDGHVRSDSELANTYIHVRPWVKTGFTDADTVLDRHPTAPATGWRLSKPK